MSSLLVLSKVEAGLMNQQSMFAWSTEVVSLDVWV